MTTRNITFKAKWIKILSTVPATIRAQYVSAIYEYILNGTEPKDIHMQVGFAFFKDEIDRANRARARSEELRKQKDESSTEVADENKIENEAESTTDNAENEVKEAPPSQQHTLPYLKEPRIQMLMKDKRERCADCNNMNRPSRCELACCPKYKDTDAEAVCAMYAAEGG